MLISIVLAGIISFSIPLFYFFYDKKKKSNALLNKKNVGSKKNNSAIFQKVYFYSSRFRFTNNILLKIRKKMETLSVYDEYSLRSLIGQVFVAILSIILVIILALLILRPGWLVAFWVIVGLVFLTDLIMDYFVLRIEKKLLPQLKDYSGRVRYFFSQTHMIDEAAYESINYVGNEMKVQAQRIHNTLISVNPEEEQSKYEEIAPNRFFKVISGLMVLVKDKGDVVDEKEGSAFSRGLQAIIKELNLEIMFRSKLAYRMRYLAALTLIPIFFALPTQGLLIHAFPVISKFFESRIGFIFAMLCYSGAIVMYFIIRKLKGVNEISYKAQISRFKWEKWLIEKVWLIRVIVKIVSPNPNLKNYAKKMQLIKDSNEPITVEWLTLRQIIFSVTTVVLLITGIIYSHQREAESALYNIIPASMMTSNITEDEYKQFEKDAEFDREMIANMQKLATFTEEGIRTEIAKGLGVDEIYDSKVDLTYKRILDKYNTVENAYFKWWELIIILLFGAGIWYIPILILFIQKNLRKKDMENEVHQFLTIISILREFDNITVYTLLMWLERFSVTFKEPLQRAILNFDSGPDEALDELSNEISFEAFSQIVEKLKLSVSRLSVKEAFEDIEIEREFYLEQRKEMNERTIKNRADIGFACALTPSGMLLVLYIIFPMIYTSSTQMQDLMSKI